ncbi:PREDICTED: tyrosine-protein phosphatase non-receptor type 9-like isoform X2 [Priapulus caudatus]|uniref:Tyrosine-protein phosphatase non-receptor type 9-like isoform X2 n=1 Tax=Priapulus caudatus TaxID=37621 RepID=A0ABM1E819_PRICU|nr:PREDICTED: tyrosine-protein phosphatase non-receptor type 9-like isoform X2 [Priapulus caudatus]
MATREFIEGANHLRQQWGAGPISWNVAVKFLMARKFDVRRALELYQAHENIRSQEGLLNIDPHVEPLKKELFSGKFSILPSRDSNGAAIAVFSAVLHQPLSISHRTVLQCVVYQLDVALESAETAEWARAHGVHL